MLHTAERVPAEINVHETAGCQCDGGRNQMSPSRPSLQNRAWPTTYLQRKQAKQQPAPSSTLPATCPRDPFLGAATEHGRDSAERAPRGGPPSVAG